jgi:hypothetical protein
MQGTVLFLNFNPLSPKMQATPLQFAGNFAPLSHGASWHIHQITLNFSVLSDC